MIDWNPRANDLFVRAAAIEIATERQHFLDEQCGSDTALRQQVESLLSSGQQIGSFLEQPAVLAPTVAPVTERPDTIIGPYKLLEQIGEGGMGLVFVAEQQQPMRRKVALKLIKPGMDTRDVIARFEAERQALALMDHPNIAKVLDAGATESGRPYFVMELVKGIPLTDYCDQNQLTPGERLRLFVNVCQAVQHAHTKGIVHRDLKPSNVLVTLHDGTPVAKVIDFGVAKAIGQHLTEKTIYTRFSQMIGTPLYMSPEQAEMSGLDIDTRSDIYSLGVLLYELLTGTTPFDRERLQKAAFDEIRRIIREEEPPTPSIRLTTLGGELTAVSAKRKTELGKLSALVGGDLDWIAMKCLDKDRTRRYDTASALAQDIQHYLADEPVLAGPPSTGYRLRKFVKRNRGPVVAAVMLLLAVLAGIAGTSWGWIEALSQRDDAVLARTEEAEQRRLALANAAEARANELRARDNELKAAVSAALATQQEKLAREQAKIAKENETKAEWRLYASHIDLAQREWENGNMRLFHHYLNQCRLDFRGWEHDFLHTFANQNQQTLRGHLSGVNCVAFSPDGKRLVSTSAGSRGGSKGGAVVPRGEMKVWDVASGQEILTLKVQFALSVAFSPDGKLLAATSSGGGLDRLDRLGETESTLLTVWDAVRFEKLWAIEEVGTRCLAFSPDGKRLASASRSYRGSFKPQVEPMRVRDAASGKEIMTLTWPSPVRSLAFSPDGNLLAGSTTGPPVIAPDKRGWRGGTGLVKVWDAASGKEIRTFTESVDSVAFSPNGKHLASASHKRGPGLIDRQTDYTVKVWDVGNGEELLTLTGHRTSNTSSGLRSPDTTHVAYSPDGKLLAVGLDLWEAATGKKLPITFKGHMGGITSVAFSPDSKRLATASEDKTVKLWNLAGTQGAVTIKSWGPSPKFNYGAVSAFSPDGKLAIASGDTVKLFDAASGQEVQTLIKEEPMAAGPIGKRPASVWQISFSPDGKRLAGLVSVPLLDTVKVWEAATGKEILSLKGEVYNQIYCVAFSPDGKLLTSVRNHRDKSEVDGTDCTVKVWDAISGEEFFTLKQRVVSVAFSHDGKYLATAGSKGLQVLDTASGKELFTLKGQTSFVHGMAFSPDGKRLAAGGSGLKSRPDIPHEIKLWDVASGQDTLTLRGHTGAITSVAFSPDGKRLASASSDMTVKVWDAASAQEILTLRGYTSFVRNMTFSPDGKRLAISMNNGTTIILDASTSMNEPGQK